VKAPGDFRNSARRLGAFCPPYFSSQRISEGLVFFFPSMPPREQRPLLPPGDTKQNQELDPSAESANFPLFGLATPIPIAFTLITAAKARLGHHRTKASRNILRSASADRDSGIHGCGGCQDKNDVFHGEKEQAPLLSSAARLSDLRSTPPFQGPNRKVINSPSHGCKIRSRCQAFGPFSLAQSISGGRQLSCSDRCSSTAALLRCRS